MGKCSITGSDGGNWYSYMDRTLVPCAISGQVAMVAAKLFKPSFSLGPCYCLVVARMFPNHVCLIDAARESGCMLQAR